MQPPPTIRAFERRDIPRVCALFARTFRSGKTYRGDALAAAIEATYLTAPGYTPERGSLVHVDAQGEVDGFMGIINIAMRLGDRLLQAGVLSAYMADRPDANPAIGVSLVRGAMQRGLDLIFSDTANRTSLDMSRPLRFSVLPLASLEWTKLLRPAGTAAYMLGRRRRGLERWLARPAAAIDALLPHLAATEVNPRSLAGGTDRPIAVADFVAQAPRFLAGFTLRPAWDETELTWLVTQAALQTKHGPLHIREVLDRSGRSAGLYLLYARRGGVATALQILAQPGREDLVVGHLLELARQTGAVAVRGAASNGVVLGMMRQSGIFYRHVMSLVVWTADPAIAAAISGGNVCLGGLAGETWARIFSDSFD